MEYVNNMDAQKPFIYSSPLLAEITNIQMLESNTVALGEMINKQNLEK